MYIFCLEVIYKIRNNDQRENGQYCGGVKDFGDGVIEERLS
jgi:hypothetical protein